MVLTADHQVEVFALVVSQEVLGAPHFLLLVCNGVRRDAAAVMQGLAAREGLQWTSITSLLKTFPSARRLSFSNQREEALITHLAERRDLHTLDLSNCSGVSDVSALASCANLHTLKLTGCFAVVDVSALASCSSLHTLDLSGCKGLANVSELAGCASLHTLKLSRCAEVRDVSALASCVSKE